MRTEILVCRDGSLIQLWGNSIVAEWGSWREFIYYASMYPADIYGSWSIRLTKRTL